MTNVYAHVSVASDDIRPQGVLFSVDGCLTVGTQGDSCDYILCHGALNMWYACPTYIYLRSIKIKFSVIKQSIVTNVLKILSPKCTALKFYCN